MQKCYLDTREPRLDKAASCSYVRNYAIRCSISMPRRPAFTPADSCPDLAASSSVPRRGRGSKAKLPPAGGGRRKDRLMGGFPAPRKMTLVKLSAGLFMVSGITGVIALSSGTGHSPAAGEDMLATSQYGQQYPVSSSLTQRSLWKMHDGYQKPPPPAAAPLAASPVTAAPLPTATPPPPSPQPQPSQAAPAQQPQPQPQGSAQEDAQQLLDADGWGGQFGCLASIINVESGWNVYATNPSSGAYGIPQALPGYKMSVAGPDWQNSAYTQLNWMINYYIKPDYGDPCGAWAHEQADGWY